MSTPKPWPSIRRPNRTLTPDMIRKLLADIDPHAVIPTAPARRRSRREVRTR